MNSVSPTHRPEVQRLLLALAIYFLLHTLLRTLLSPSPDYDEAEQLLLSQWLRPGYTDQPPLYTWLQMLLFELLGTGILAISLLKNLLLWLTYLFVFLAGRELYQDELKAVLATLSLLLLPQIVWESQRDMTHTVLAVATAAATLWLALRGMRRRHVFDYLCLGLAIGVGILAKANYLLFTLILLLAMLSCRQGRAFLASRYLLITAVTAILLSSPYLLWMLNNQDIVLSASSKFKIARGDYYLKGMRSLLTNSFYFYAPMVGVLLLLLPPGKTAAGFDESTDGKRLLLSYLLWLAVVLVVIVLVAKITHVKERWLQPLLFISPLVYFLFVPRDRLTAGRRKTFYGLCLMIGLAILITFTMRVVAAPYLDRYSRLNFPIAAFADDMQAQGFKQGVIFSDNRFLAGSMLLHFPESEGITPGYDQHLLLKQLATGPIAILWRPEHWLTPIPEPTMTFFSEKLGIDLSTCPIYRFQQEYLWGKGATVELAAIILPAASTARTIVP